MRRDVPPRRYLCDLLRKSSGLRASFSGETLMETRHIDDHAGVRAFADLLDLIAGAHVELDAAAINLGDLSIGSDAMTHRRGCEVMDIDFGADCALARVKVGSHGIQGRVLHGGYHHGRGEDRR